eukprot:COSAG03_NODE_6047_length_1124_cov_1.246829_1_plen_259_part_01
MGLCCKTLVLVAVLVTDRCGAAPTTSSVAAGHDVGIKRGLAWSGRSPHTCDDAAALGLSSSWNYNWNTDPDPAGVCRKAGRSSLSSEYVPMCWGSGTCLPARLAANHSEAWRASGAKYLLGFNEPDGKEQSNILPKAAAELWPGVQSLASANNLTLVSPAVAVFHAENGSRWLDEFFGNCSVLDGCEVSQIEYRLPPICTAYLRPCVSVCVSVCLPASLSARVRVSHPIAFCSIYCCRYIAIHNYGGNSQNLLEVVRTA